MKSNCRNPPSPSAKMKGEIMSYDYKKEFIKWKKWKEKEEDLLRQLNVSNNTIAELRKFD